MIENYFEKDLIFEKKTEKNNKMTPNLKFLENQTQIFKNLKENTKKTPNLEFL